MSRAIRTVATVALVSLALNFADGGGSSAQNLPWMNRNLSLERRADLLIAQMTLEQKVQQNADHTPPAETPLATIVDRAFGMNVAPSALHVSEIRGNRVTLRWTPPLDGSATGFLVDAGRAPGTTEVTLPLGHTPTLTVDATSGVFFVRVRTQSIGETSGPSNEIRVVVGVPTPPSPPENLLAVVQASAMALTWRNTFAGGVPTSLVLDVTGSLTTSIPLALAETVGGSALPAGTYTVAMRAVNAAGSSAPSNSVSITIPTACSGAPQPPANFVAYDVAGRMFVHWDLPAGGPAPTQYMVNVTGAFVGSFATTQRQLSAPAPPGSYTLSVLANSPCGSSAMSPAQTVTVEGESAIDPAPQLLMIDFAHIAQVRESLRQGNSRYRAALVALQADANRALRLAPVSVMDKAVTPPSGDKHDYMSQAPYYWPDPSKPNGRPYIRRDGERNPEIDRITDRANLGRLALALPSLALADYFTGRPEYGEHAARLVRTWFLDPATRMNPHLKFAQGIPGIAEGRSAGIIESRLLPDILGAVTALADSPAWTAADDQALKEWMRAYLTWLLENPQRRAQTARGNNQETWYYVQVVALAFFTDQTDIVRQTLLEARHEIGRQFRPDGSQPRELERTRAWDYSIFNLSAFTTLAAFGARVGIDLWNYSTADGRSLRGGIEYLLPFATGQRRFPYRQIGELNPALLHPVLRRAAVGLNEPRYRDLAHQFGGGTRRLELTLP